MQITQTFINAGAVAAQVFRFVWHKYFDFHLIVKQFVYQPFTSSGIQKPNGKW